MVGHSYHDGQAVFNNLPAVQEGDQATVTTDCGTLVYQAVKVDRNVPKKDYPHTIASYVNNFSGSPRLMTTTCSGRWNIWKRSHDDVTVIEWKLIKFIPKRGGK
jgi:sortase (surface protein transpeptidase)